METVKVSQAETTPCACREWQRGEMRAYRLHQRLAADASPTPEPRPLEQLWTQKAAAVQRENLRHWLQEQCQDEAETMVYQPPALARSSAGTKPHPAAARRLAAPPTLPW